MRRVPLPLALRGRLLPALLTWALALSSPVTAAAFIVKDGKPQADIVVSAKAPPMATLAASELQTYVQRITGAKLPIVNDPGGAVAVHVYVGQSPHTDRLKLGVTDLKHDAYRMASGPNWLALLGRDTRYVPPKPHARSRGDRPRTLKAWDAITGEKWGTPYVSTFKGYNRGMDLWSSDGRGSINAVYGFLRGLGVRWYFPGPVGEVTPRLSNIPLPKVNTVVRADFPLRNIHQYYNAFFQTNRAEILWQLRLGLNSGREALGSTRGHGTVPVHARDEVKKAHPEYFALWGGKRATHHKGGCGAPCLSSPGLLKQNVKYVRMLYDRYNEPMVNVAPADGYTRLCQCKLCQGKGTPERGWTGQISDYVWDYVNRVAKEVYKTHPDRKVSCIAYGAYLQPPLKIAKLSPNLVIVMCGWRSNYHDPETRQRFLNLRKAWLKKLPSKQLYTWDYYLHARPGRAWEGVPAYFPHIIAVDLRSLKGISGGDFIETARNWPNWKIKWHALATNHLNVYVTARLYWDVNQDVDALLAEYYAKFYGPARKEMKAFVDYAEANYPKATKDKAVIDKLFELIGAARAAAGDGAYGKRVDLIVQFMAPLRQLRAKIALGRKNVPRARAYRRLKKDIKLDGKLDEPFWTGMATYSLRELQTGRAPAYGTSFRVAWAGDSLYFGIVCREDTKTLNIGSRKDGDASIWAGDSIELLLETQTHAYYQIAISPSGALIDADRKKGIKMLWSSCAEVATHVGDGYWSMELRLPVAGDNQEALNPNSGVSGRRPSKIYPWYINVCRQRMRDSGRYLSAFSPTGKGGFHVPLKFGRLYMR